MIHNLPQSFIKYQSLPEKDKLIIKAMALKTGFSSLNDINEILRKNFISNFHDYNKCLKFATDAGIIIYNPDHYKDWGSSQYRISVPFLIHIIPETGDFYAFIRDEIVREGYYVRLNPYDEKLRFYRKFLFALMFHPEIPSEIQDKLLKMDSLNDLAMMLDLDAYKQQLTKVNANLLGEILQYKVNQLIYNLMPINELFEYFGEITRLSGNKQIKNVLLTDEFQDFISGNFKKLAEKSVSVNHLNIQAIYQLTIGDVTKAYSFFEMSMKTLRKENKSIVFPPTLFDAFYYLVCTLCQEPEIMNKNLTKILNALNKKKSLFQLENNFVTVIYDRLNNQLYKESSVNRIIQIIELSQPSLNTIFEYLILYMSDVDIPEFLRPGLLNLINQARNSGYFSFAYELAYAANQWIDNKETNRLYDDIHVRMQYQPVLSALKKQEEWEKNLNLIFNAIGEIPENIKSVPTESTTRICYSFDPLTLDFEPFTQTKSARGNWSRPKNIGLKTFFEGKSTGMTDHDLRISKSMRRCNSSYYNRYGIEFTSETCYQMIGHPYIYLKNSEGVKIDFVAAEPEIIISKKGKNYSLTTDIPILTEPILVVEETNTRYKVYKFDKKQIDLINTINSRPVIVPEKGRDVLLKLMGVMSNIAHVQSDTLASNDTDLTLTTVDSDSRIRIQLIPYSDGFKAELFCKPFGDKPPYCKPGVGGKVLIAKEKNVQVQVQRDLKLEQKNSEVLINEISTLNTAFTDLDRFTFEDPQEVLQLLEIIASHTDICIPEWPEGEKLRIKSFVDFNRLKLKVKSNNQWFEVQGNIQVDENSVLTIQQILSLIKQSDSRFIELSPGEFLSLSAKLKKQFSELLEFSVFKNEKINLNRFAAHSLQDFFENAESVEGDKIWLDFRNKIQHSVVEDIQTPSLLQATLRPYQEDGFRWMNRLAFWGAGACLADDMGLGKTVQTLSVLLHRSQSGPALVICPVSVTGNWITEVKRFAPTLRIRTFSNNNRQHIIEELNAGDLLILTYGLLQSEQELLASKNFATLVLDEAHVIKNVETKTSKAAMTLKADFRIALTGTPVQNHLGEIWNLFQFLNPGLLGDMKHFSERFIKNSDKSSQKRLQKLITPFILRRIKSDVLDELPPKTEIVRKIELSDEEKVFYEALRRQALQNIETNEDNKGTKHLKVLAEITKLRQASCHPRLVNPLLEISSSKLDAFLVLMEELRENKHKALVFSQFVSHLALVREALDQRGIMYEYLDGSCSQLDRERSVSRFQSGSADLFLISLKAGGLGLNLTAADFVIHMDPWWNPAIEDQASDRAHRIGQTRPVTIYRLVAEGTIEEKIIQLHHTKRDMAESLLAGTDVSAKLTVNELLSLFEND